MTFEKFDEWNDLKKEISGFDSNTFFVKERQVWYIHKGINIGFESNGKGGDFKRPVLVLKKVGNLFFVVSMTTKGKDNNFYYHLDNSYFGKNSSIMLSQVKVIDKKRFFEHIGTIKENDFEEIKKQLQNLLF